MNENPMPGAVPTPEPTPTPQPTPQPMMEPQPMAAAPQPMPTPQPTTPETPGFTPAPGQVPTPTAPITTPSATPMPEATPKKKTGLIVGILIAVLVICGCALAAFFLLGGKKDPDTIVYNAFVNLIADDKNSHENTVFDGSVSIGSMGISLYDLTISAKTAKTASEINLGLNSSMLTGDEMNIGASLIVKDKNIFAKLEGISEIAEDYGIGIDLSAIEGEWYQTDVDQISSIVSSTVTPNINLYNLYNECEIYDEDTYETDCIEEYEEETPETACITNELKSLSEKGDEFAKLYQSNKFISATEYTGDKIAAKKDTLYEVTISKVKLVDFMNAVIGSNLLEGVFNCMGTSNRGMSTIDVEDLEELEIPTIYVEVNKNEELTRLYLPIAIEEVELTIDFSIDHPAKLEILEPASTSTLEDLIETLMTTTRRNSFRTVF